jgi:prepilin-type processing-associated H-X9-DG protein
MYADDHEGYGPISHATGCFSDASGARLPGGMCNSALALAPYEAGWADYYTQGAPTSAPPNWTVSNWKINPLWICDGGGRRSTYKMLAYRGGNWASWQIDGGSVPGNVRSAAAAALVGDAWGWDRMVGNLGNVGAVYGYWWHFVTPCYPGDINSGAPDYNGDYCHRYWDSLTAHNGRNNMAFVDGHVKSLSAREMIADMDWWVAAFQ